MINTSTLNITPEILSLIAEIDEFKGTWRALGTLAPERLASLRHVATIESIGSSTRIEGSKLSDREVDRLLSNLEIHSFASRDEQEVGGYAKTMELVFESYNEITLTENHIKQLHRDLLSFSDKDEKHRGNYKTSSNSVAAFDAKGKQIGIFFETATPFDTPPGYVYVPYSSLESIIEQNKENYYLALRQTQKTIRTKKPNWNPWMIFFLRSLQKQIKRLSAKIEKEKLIVADLPEISLLILDHAKQHGRITIGEIAKLTSISRNTLKEHFRLLIKRELLSLHGSGRGAWYTLK